MIGTIMAQLTLILSFVIAAPLRHYLAGFAHWGYGAVMLLIPLFASDCYILMLHILTGVITMATRRKMSSCIFTSIDNDVMDIPESLRRYVDFDIIFPAITLLSLLRLAVQFKRGQCADRGGPDVDDARSATAKGHHAFATRNR